ncbi:hypothetical protein V1264_004088 [Littorina saxatilis]|uniref:Reverse transcriptase RNase H-like domain-containing protein n=1 Tax=Littorina saxatilis TaxID=31220 RepID=A0AAN9B1U2_9CAEN
MASQEEVQALVAQFKVEGEALGKDGASLNKYVEDNLREERAARRKRENDIALQEKELAAARELKERELAEQAKIKERELAEQAKIENRRLDIEEEKANREAKLQPDDDDVLHPVLYASRKLLERETRYSTVERECLALVWAVDKFHRYLFGSHFFVETDHRPLTYLRQSKTANGRLLRWALSLQEYSFTVVPIPGVRNFEADVLSRLTK